MKRLLFSVLIAALAGDIFPQWVPQNSNTVYHINEIHFLNPNDGFFCGSEGIFKTSNGGNTWTRIPFTTLDSIYLNGCLFQAMHVFNSTTFVVAGFAFFDNAEVIIRTTNGGATFSIVHIGPWDTGLNDISFNNSTNGYAVGRKGKILLTNDGGVSWAPANNIGVTSDLYAIAFNQSFPYFAGDEVIKL